MTGKEVIQALDKLLNSTLSFDVNNVIFYGVLGWWNNDDTRKVYTVKSVYFPIYYDKKYTYKHKDDFVSVKEVKE